jgi:hypothetical protein
VVRGIEGVQPDCQRRVPELRVAVPKPERARYRRMSRFTGASPTSLRRAARAAGVLFRRRTRRALL